MGNAARRNEKADMSGAEGPNKVVPYRNAKSYIPGNYYSYKRREPGKTPFHARTQDYTPEEIKDHTGSIASKGQSQEGMVTIHSDSCGALPSMIGLEGVVNDHQK